MIRREIWNFLLSLAYSCTMNSLCDDFYSRAIKLEFSWMKIIQYLQKYTLHYITKIKLFEFVYQKS